MIFIDKILQWGRDNGFSAIYGTPEQVNEMMTSTDFGASQNGTVIYCHLITDSETIDGRDAATVAIYFCRLCDFDFNGEDLLPVQEELKDTGKQLLHHIAQGNEMAYDGVRWQYGYDDYAENVAWVCLRVTLTALSADCFGREIPTESGCWSAEDENGDPIAFYNIIETNGTLEGEGKLLCFDDADTSVLVIAEEPLLSILVSVDGKEWDFIPKVDGTFTVEGLPSGSIVSYIYSK